MNVLGQSYRSLIVSDITDVKPDSLASMPPLITRASDVQVVTIRIIPLKTTADWKIVEEYRDRYVFKRVFHCRRFVDILFSDWIVAFHGRWSFSVRLFSSLRL